MKNLVRVRENRAPIIHLTAIRIGVLIVHQARVREMTHRGHRGRHVKGGLPARVALRGTTNRRAAVADSHAMVRRLVHHAVEVAAVVRHAAAREVVDKISPCV